MATNSVLDDPEFRQKMRQAYEVELQLVERLRAELSTAEQRLDALNQLRGTALDPAPILRQSTARPTTLSGDSLRAEAHRILREVDPSQRGVHPRRIAELIQQEGYLISGVADDKTANVRSTIGYGPKSAPLFPLQWQMDSTRGSDSGPDVLEIGSGLMQMTERPNYEIITVALFLLGGDRAFVSTEDIAVQANELAPGRFTWRKYKDQVNLELVRVHLSALKKSNGVLVHGSGSKGWMLTRAGLAVATDAAREIDPRLSARAPMSRAERHRLDSERARMLNSEAYDRWRAGSGEPLTRREAEELFKVDDYVTGAARERKIERALTAFADDTVLAPLLRSRGCSARDG